MRAICSRSNCVGEPIAWRRAIVLGQHSPDDILVELDAEGPRDDQCDAPAAEAWIAPLQFDGRVDELRGGSLGTWLAAPVGREKRLVLAPDEGSVERKQRRGPEGYGDLLESGTAKGQRPESEQDAVTRREIRSSPAQSGENEELLFEQQILGEERSGAAKT